MNIFVNTVAVLFILLMVGVIIFVGWCFETFMLSIIVLLFALFVGENILTWIAYNWCSEGSKLRKWADRQDPVSN